jgi:hypothetical protein
MNLGDNWYDSLDEGPAHLIAFTHTQPQKKRRYISMTQVGFEPAVSEFEL